MDLIFVASAFTPLLENIVYPISLCELIEVGFRFPTGLKIVIATDWKAKIHLIVYILFSNS